MRYPLTHYINTTISHPILNDIYITDEGLEYKDLKYITNDIQTSQKIGAEKRERAYKLYKEGLEQQKAALENEKHEKTNIIHFLETKIKKIQDKPSDNNVSWLENQLTRQKEKEQTVSDEITTLQKEIQEHQVTSPTHAALQQYSYQDLHEKYHNYQSYQAAKEKYEAIHKSTVERIEDYLLDYKNKNEEYQHLNEEVSIIQQQLKELEKEIEQLKEDIHYQELVNRKDDLMLKVGQCDETQKQLNIEKGRLDANYQTETKNLTDTQQEFDKYQQDADIINPIIEEKLETLDNYKYQAATRIKDDILEANHCKINTRGQEVPALPKQNKFAEDIKQQLRDLKTQFVANTENDTEQPIQVVIELLEKEISELSTIKQKLYEAAVENLKTNIFTTLKDIHDDVVKDLDSLKECMEENNPSLFKLFSTYELSSQHDRKPDLLKNDVSTQNAIIDSISKKIFDTIEASDAAEVDIQDIKAIVLSELDPKNWYDLSFQYENKMEERQPLTTKAIASLSTGERARSYYIPMLSLIDMIHRKSKPTAPKIITMDEAFNALDNEQTAHILRRIHDVSDLFIATIPSGRAINMVENTTRFDTIKIQQHVYGDTVITSCEPCDEYEEYEDD